MPQTLYVVDAFALVNPSRELAILLGPPFAGILIGTVGAGWVYAGDVSVDLRRAHRQAVDAEDAAALGRREVDAVDDERRRLKMEERFRHELSGKTYAAYLLTSKAQASNPRAMQRTNAGMEAVRSKRACAQLSMRCDAMPGGLPVFD